MKGKNRFFVKVFCMMIAVIVPFLIGDADKASAASILIPVSEFTADGTTYTDAGTFYKSFGGGYLEGSDSPPCLVAPVRIPPSATKINKILVYLEDDGYGVYWPYFRLNAIDMATGSVLDYWEGDVTIGTNYIQTIELVLPYKTLIKGRVYQLGTCLAAGQYLMGAKVIYTP